MKLIDLEFANDAMTGAGETADRSVVKRTPDEARAERTCNDLKRRNVGCILVKP